MKEIDGLEVETVGDLIGGDAEQAVATRVEPPRHPDQPDWLGEGIFFNMPEETYHAIHACSASGLKKLSVSSMDYWAASPLNLEKEDAPEPGTGKLSGKELGRAYHTRICEGQQTFADRYYIALDKDVVRFDAEAAGKKLCVTIADIRAAIDELGGKPKGTGKDALIEQLLDFDPDAFIWDRMVATHEQANQGKIQITMKLFRRIEIAWAMIAGDPQLRGAFMDGHPEVSIFWYDKATGAPMKARLDYLKMNHIVDLKSFANKQGKPVQRAIDMAISYEKYYIAVVVYLEAIAAAKEMIRKTKNGWNVFRYERDPKGEWQSCMPTKEQREWCWTWAHQPEPEVLFVFQQTGIAPVTRGRIMAKGSTFTVTDYAVQFLKRKWVRCAQAYGVDPWVDFEGVVRTEDEALVFAATDFGEVS